jgi:hypothetical protein
VVGEFASRDDFEMGPEFGRDFTMRVDAKDSKIMGLKLDANIVVIVTK